MDWDAVERTVEDALEAIREMEHEPFRGFKDVWPGLACEWTSIGIAEALEQRGLGGWTFVQASRPDEINGHAWLECRDENQDVLYSIDVTLHQFSHHSKPHVGPGRTPAAAEFTSINFEGDWHDWPVLRHNLTYAKFAEATVEQLRDGQGPTQ